MPPKRFGMPFGTPRRRQVEVEIRYEDEQFRLLVRDDGKGIDPGVLSGQGPEGHFGLRGMRERAKLIEGKLMVWSEVDAGTEVELAFLREPPTLQLQKAPDYHNCSQEK